MKSICDIMKGNSADLKENILYWFSRILKAFAVYWYTFAYVLLVPALCFIVTGILFLIGMIIHNEILQLVWGVGMGVSAVYAAIQSIYRWIKTSFCISNAVYHDDYTKENFEKSIRITDKNWWRILGNLMLVGIIGGLLMWLITNLIWSLSFASTDFGGIQDALLWLWQDETINESSLQDILGQFQGNGMLSLITDIISQILGSIFSVFMLVFIIVFFRRLEIESQSEL